MRLQTALTLGRTSNLPTVWGNVLVGTVAVGADPVDWRVALVIVAVSLAYLGGMFLNDAFDVPFDTQHRPDRPIPAGEVSRRAVFGWGFGMLAAALAVLFVAGTLGQPGSGLRPFAAGLVLASAIVFYDWRHKGNPLAPVVMGTCRGLIYVVAAVAVSETAAGAWLPGLLLVCYVAGLTYLARQEHLNRLTSGWPLVPLGVPAVWAGWQAMADPLALVFWVAFVAWVAWAVRLLWRRQPGDVPQGVGCLIAGICLWDALLLAILGKPVLGLVAVACFIGTRLFQRHVQPT